MAARASGDCRFAISITSGRVKTRVLSWAETPELSPENSSTQVNILIVKNLETGKLENKNVTVETHFTSDVGDKIEFENSERNLWKSFLYFFFSLITLLGGIICTYIFFLSRWIFTGRSW